MKTLTKQEATELKEYKDVAVVTSLRISELTGKEHFNVMVDCRKVFRALDKTEGTYTCNYTSGRGKRPFPVFMLPALELDAVLTGYSVDYRVQLLSELHIRRDTENNRLDKPSLLESNETVGFEEASSDKFKAIMMAQKNMEKLLSQQDNLIDMIKDMDEPQPIETVIVGNDTRLSDLIGKGKTKSTLKMIGL